MYVLFYVRDLTQVPILKLYSVSDRRMNGYGAWME